MFINTTLSVGGVIVVITLVGVEQILFYIFSVITHTDATPAPGHGRAGGPVVGGGVVALHGAQTRAAVAPAHGVQPAARRRHAARRPRTQHRRYQRPATRRRVPTDEQLYCYVYTVRTSQ